MRVRPGPATGGPSQKAGDDMNLDIADDDAEELRTVLDGILGDLSHEIADTDNAEYRAKLRQRRERIQRVREALDG